MKQSEEGVGARAATLQVVLWPLSSKIIILVYDSTIAASALFLAYTIRNELPTSGSTGEFIPLSCFLFGALASVVFAALGLHQAVWRHASTGEIVRIVEAVTVAILIYVLLIFLLGRIDSLPRSVPLIAWLLLVVVLGASRLAWRLVYEHIRRQRRPPLATKPLIVVGSGDECSLLLRGIRGGAVTPYRPVGIIDVLGRNIGRRIHGILVLGRTSELSEIVSRIKKDGQAPVTIAFAEECRQSMRGLVRQAESLGLKSVCIPNIVELRAGLSEGRIELEPLSLNALIGREPVQLDHEAVQRFVGGCKVLITGAGGSIGSELARLMVDLQPTRVILLDHCEYNLYAIEQELRGMEAVPPTEICLADIRDRDRIRSIFKETQPDLIFHAAALKHVPIVESHPIEGVLTNILGTCNVADAASAVGVRAMVQISTDKAVNPSSVMGATKRVAEFYCQALDAGDWSAMVEGCRRPRFLTVRFGNVIGSSGSVVPLFQKQLSQGGPLTVTHPEMRRFFMTIREASELVLHASASAARSVEERGSIFVLDMGDPVGITDIARQVVRLAGKEPGRDIEVRVVGMRPGEKLTEELFDRYEERVMCNAKGVFTARSQPMKLSMLRAQIAELEKLCALRDDLCVRRALEELVPGCNFTVKADQAA